MKRIASLYALYRSVSSGDIVEKQAWKLIDGRSIDVDLFTDHVVIVFIVFPIAACIHMFVMINQ
jgi:hypothetical protein